MAIFNIFVRTFGQVQDALAYIHTALSKCYPRHQACEARWIFEDQADGSVKLKLQTKRTSDTDWTTKAEYTV